MIEREINAKKKKRFRILSHFFVKTIQIKVRSANSNCKTPLSLNFQDVP